MTTHPDDLFKLADAIRYDLTAAQAKITELKTALGALNLKTPQAHVCPKPHCRIPLATAQLLTEHLENVHGELVAAASVTVEKTDASHEVRS